jgi:hypothetical protein
MKTGMMMMVRLLCVVAALCASVDTAAAACSGSSPTRTAASASRTDVNDCVTAAASGDTILVPAGSASWSSRIALPATKDLIIKGGGGATTMNCVGTPGTSGYTCTATNSTSLTCNGGCFGLNLAASHRISGFTMTGNGSGYLVSCDVGNQSTAKHFRVDHNRLVSTSGWQPIRCFGDANAVHPRGIWDHNRLENGIAIHTNGTDYQLDESNVQHQLWAQDPEIGGISRIFVEANYFVTSVHTTNFTDGNYAARVTIRFNTTNGPTITGFEFHSPQGSNRGFQSWEAYGNTLMNLDTTDGCYHGISSIRGGSGVYFNNAMSGTISGCNYDGLMDNVRSDWSSSVDGVGPCNGSSNWDQNTSGQQGWHCRDQVGAFKDNTLWNHSPAGAWNQQLIPAYFWGNTRAGNPLVFTVDSGGRSDVHIVKDRDYREYVASFNGTSGVGVGPIGSRPSTCTTGVGYWATDEGTWNTSTAGADGRLYRCVSTNTWSLYYTPYTYPHPWATDGVSTTAPAPPTNVRIIKAANAVPFLLLPTLGVCVIGRRYRSHSR